MNSYCVWDWKYKIYFNSQADDCFIEWKNRLSAKEVEIYDRIYAFYKSFYSFGILWGCIDEQPELADQMADKALKNIKGVIRTPDRLIKYYSAKIKKKFKNGELAKKLLAVLDYSANGREIAKEYWAVISWLFGEAMPDMTAKFLSENCQNAKKVRQKKVFGDCVNLFENIYCALTKNTSIINDFGESTLSDFTTSIVDDIGFGEWWDREISQTGKDELVLYTNDGAVKDYDYKYTIIHETYPGHGHFYNSVRNLSKSMDHGAMELIEGWATYCEWHTLPSAYVEEVKRNAMTFLRDSYRLTLNDIAEGIVKKNKKRGKPFYKYVSSMIYATQYVGYMESYYLGALWLEQLFQKGIYTPKSFLQMLHNSNKGVFFKLWM